MADLERLLARNVRPRKYVRDERPIIAIGRELILVERTGEVLPVTKLSHLIASEASSILSLENAPRILLPMREAFGALPNWYDSVAPVRRTRLKPKHTDKPIQTQDVVVRYLGFKDNSKSKGSDGHGRTTNRYHFPIDPNIFSDQGLRSMVTVDETEEDYLALYQWAVDVREWCRENGLKVTSRKGGLAAQLLRDPRFYPEPRRKVPHATNARARNHLPGNHYQLVAQRGKHHSAHYLDMSAAHHTVASSLTFPSSNELFACGRFKDPPTEPSEHPWALAGTRKFDTLMTGTGLFLLTLAIPPYGEYDFPPPWAQKPGLQLAYVYSNELPLLAGYGIAIRGIEACWLSGTIDIGLNKYAEWSLESLSEMTDERKRWGKSVLLSTYGMLAARPVTREFGFNRADGGEPFTYLMRGGVPLPVIRKASSTPHESSIANVIHRGMIEAEVRLRALSLARDLEANGNPVLCIYADSVIVAQGKPLPTLPDYWRVQCELTNLSFLSDTGTHFTSDQMVKLPGIPREVSHKLTSRQALQSLGGLKGDKLPSHPLSSEMRHLVSLAVEGKLDETDEPQQELLPEPVAQIQIVSNWKPYVPPWFPDSDPWTITDPISKKTKYDVWCDSLPAGRLPEIIAESRA